MNLSELINISPYMAYAYSYPHKTAYRQLPRGYQLRELWAEERRDALFLYLHVPFCEMRCGFCNLFTTVHPGGDLVTAYLDALERQAVQVREALGPATFARMAVGGGTPTYLHPAELERLFDLAAELFDARPAAIPTSVETSPATATADRLAILRERGVERVSIGVQSFIDAEAHAGGRAQQHAVVEAALERIRAAGFPILNIDLIYGLAGQTLATWRQSLEAALAYRPEELYLYPLYVRPLTGLGRRDAQPSDLRLELYRAGRELLLERGYTQVSMRMFRAPHAPAAGGPHYCCQRDGMVGIGCGARSYTSGLHYSSEFAVGSQSVRAILADYIARPSERFAVADYGYELTAEDRRRRFVIQSLLQADGLDLDDYAAEFGGSALSDLPELHELSEHGLAERRGAALALTERGMELSDVVGPWLYAAHVRPLMEAWELR